MLRNKEPELAEKIDSSFGCFDLGFYRVNFVFGSRHLIIVLEPTLPALAKRVFVCAVGGSSHQPPHPNLDSY